MYLYIVPYSVTSASTFHDLMSYLCLFTGDPPLSFTAGPWASASGPSVHCTSTTITAIATATATTSPVQQEATPSPSAPTPAPARFAAAAGCPIFSTRASTTMAEARAATSARWPPSRRRRGHRWSAASVRLRRRRVSFLFRFRRESRFYHSTLWPLAQ